MPPLRAAEPKRDKNWQQNEYFKIRYSAILKIFRKMKGNLINNCDFLEFMISIRAATVINRPGYQKVSTPLDVNPSPI